MGYARVKFFLCYLDLLNQARNAGILCCKPFSRHELVIISTDAVKGDGEITNRKGEKVTGGKARGQEGRGPGQHSSKESRKQKTERRRQKADSRQKAK